MEGLEGITALDIQNNMDGLSLNVHDYTENYQESTGSYSRTINKERHFMLNIEIQDKNVTLEIDKVFSPDYKGRQLTPEERISAEGDKEIWIQSGAEAGDGMYLTFGRMDTNILNINGMDVTTQSGADDAIEKSKDAINILNGIRSNIGAQQNRLEHTIRHQENTIENTQRAESLIRDTDMATEMMNFSAANIIQQAGQSMLTQANQSNQGVLSLLQ
jgi:flagellin